MKEKTVSSKPKKSLTPNINTSKKVELQKLNDDEPISKAELFRLKLEEILNGGQK